MPSMGDVSDTDLTISIVLILQSLGLGFILGSAFQGDGTDPLFYFCELSNSVRSVSNILVPVEEFVQQNHPEGIFIKREGDFESVLHEQCEVVLEHRHAQEDGAEPPFVESVFRGDGTDPLFYF
jgi:hypothetical protein